MGLLQNYLGLEPAYKDGCDLPVLVVCGTVVIEFHPSDGGGAQT
jgi:hypothetical protein